MGTGFHLAILGALLIVLSQPSRSPHWTERLGLASGVVLIYWGGYYRRSALNPPPLSPVKTR